MNIQIPNKDYFITYSNYLFFEGQILSFRNKLLFNITNIPILINFNVKANCYIVNRKQLTLKKAKELLINEPKIVDVTNLPWYTQEQLNHVFNL